MDARFWQPNGKYPSFPSSNPIIITEDPEKLPSTVEISKPWDIRPLVSREPCPKPEKQKQMFHKAIFSQLQKLIDPDSWIYKTNKQLALDLYRYGGVIPYAYFNHSSVWDVASDLALDPLVLLNFTGEIPLYDLENYSFYYPNTYYMLPLPNIYTPDHSIYIESAKLQDTSNDTIEPFTNTPKQNNTLLWIIILVLFLYMILN